MRVWALEFAVWWFEFGGHNCHLCPSIDAEGDCSVLYVKCYLQGVALCLHSANSLQLQLSVVGADCAHILEMAPFVALPADSISCWAGANVVDQSPAALRATGAGLAGGGNVLSPVNGTHETVSGTCPEERLLLLHCLGLAN